MKSASLAAALAVAVFAAVPAHAKSSLAVCSVTDISPQAEGCAGFFSGNLLNDKPSNILAQKQALSSLGLAWNGTAVETLTLSGGTVDFNTLLNGTTYVGVHFGAGVGGPGNGTAFYKFDAGTDLDAFTLAYRASSNAVLFSTGVSPVPEPETYALMLAGLAAIGVMARRRSA